MAKGKSLASSLLDFLAAWLSSKDAACRVSAETTEVVPCRDAATGECSDMGWDKSVTLWNPSPVRNPGPSPWDFVHGSACNLTSAGRAGFQNIPHEARIVLVFFPALLHRVEDLYQGIGGPALA